MSQIPHDRPARRVRKAGLALVQLLGSVVDHSPQPLRPARLILVAIGFADGVFELVRLWLWASLVALVIGLRPISQKASLLILPYLLWVSFAAWLNWTIVKLNRPF